MVFLPAANLKPILEEEEDLNQDLDQDQEGEEEKRGAGEFPKGEVGEIPPKDQRGESQLSSQLLGSFGASSAKSGSFRGPIR